MIACIFTKFIMVIANDPMVDIYSFAAETSPLCWVVTAWGTSRSLLLLVWQQFLLLRLLSQFCKCFLQAFKTAACIVVVWVGQCIQSLLIRHISYRRWPTGCTGKCLSLYVFIISLWSRVIYEAISDAGSIPIYGVPRGVFLREVETLFCHLYLYY